MLDLFPKKCNFSLLFRELFLSVIVPVPSNLFLSFALSGSVTILDYSLFCLNGIISGTLLVKI